MKKMKWLFAALVMLLMLAVPMGCNATDGGGTTGEVEYLLYPGMLVITGNGAMDNYTEKSGAERGWLDRTGEIVIVEIKNGVTNIGDYAFLDCERLQIVMIPASVETIGYNAFKNCGSISTVVLSSDNPNYKIKDGMLMDVNETEIIRGLNPKVVELAPTVEIVRDSAFFGCKKLQKIDYSKSLVTEISDKAFKNCENLSEVILHDDIEYIGKESFFGCKKLSTINIEDSNVLTEIGESAFYGCSKLSKVILPKSVTRIGLFCFRDCANLSEIFINEKLSIDSSNGNHAFYDCKSLSKVYIDSPAIARSLTSFAQAGYLTAVEYYTSTGFLQRNMTVYINQSIVDVGSYVAGEKAAYQRQADLVQAYGSTYVVYRSK